MLNKKSVLVILISSLSLVGIQVSAHPGHEHDDSYLEQVKTLKNAEYELNLGEDHLGHFEIKSTKVTSVGAKLKIRQTFHLDPDVTKTVNATVTDEKIMTYSFSDGENEYLVIVDFQNLDSGDNAALRISYPEDYTDRTITTEEITISRVVE